MKYLIYRSLNDMKKDEIIPRALDIAAENNISGELHKIYTTKIFFRCAAKMAICLTGRLLRLRKRI